jgi:hypothetical protein
MSNKGNQTGTDVVEDGESIETLYNPGHASTDEGTPRETTVSLDSTHDISHEAKATLGDYLGRLTAGEVGDTGKNTYAIDHEYSEPGNLSEYNANLSQRDPDATSDENPTLGSFLDVVKNATAHGPHTVSGFNSLKHSEYVNGTNPFMGTEVKNVEDEVGHTILASTKPVAPLSTTVGNPVVPSGADATPDDFPVHQRKISQVLKRNRFNPSGDTPFMEGHTKTNFGYTVQTKMGEYDTTADPVLSSKLKKVGVELIINATGHTGLTANDFSLAALPSLAQFTGFNIIEEDNMRAQNTTSGEDVTKQRSNLLNNSNNRKSYGQLNSKIEPFDGPMPIGMVVNTISGMLSLMAFTATISALTGGFSPSAMDPARAGSVPYMAPHKLRKGRHAAKNEAVGNMFLELFGIPKTDHYWTLCTFRGILAFYGMPTAPTSTIPPDPVSIIASCLNIAMAPGYYNVVTRNVVRDTEQISDAMSDFADVDFTDAAALVMGIFKCIESIVNSATYRFIMAMTALGNQVLNAELGHPTLSAHADRNVNMLADTSNTRHKKSRLGGGGTSDAKRKVGREAKNALAWRHASAPSRYILPKEFMSALDIGSALGIDAAMAMTNKIIGYKDGRPIFQAIPAADRLANKSNLGNGSSVFDIGDVNSHVRGRLPKEYVEWIENQLDTEYMPFYFHDLRTNEIISFHAFLSDLSDGFSTDYSSMSGYGRADDVMIYNKTSRNISLSFMVAATSTEDLDIMYFNINKLVSMMYPQYSRGRTVVHGTGRAASKFVQPFSQIPTASPMIRLRFGDVIKSNYSKFNIARLFGLGQTEEAFNITLMEGVDATTMDDWEELREAAIAEVGFREQKEEMDPGGGNDTQAALNAEIVAAGGTAATSDDDFGYINPSRVLLDPAILYWPRDSSGKQARENDEARSNVGNALDLFSYGSFSPEVTVIARAATAGSATPNSFSALLASSPADPNDEADEQEGHEMAYLVEAKTGTPAHAALNYVGGSGAAYNFHRAEHSEIFGWSPGWRQELIDAAIAGTPDPSLSADVISNSTELIAQFFDGRTSNSKANPIIKSFESSRGRGLAGFMTELSFDYADMPWEIKWGKRAPQMMKVSVTFKPIHDVPMGLDSTGMMRSVAYPVGLSGQLNTDVYDDGDVHMSVAGASVSIPETTPADESGAAEAEAADMAAGGY